MASPADDPIAPPRSRARLVLAVAVLLVLGLAYAVLASTDALSLLRDPEDLRAWVAGLGWRGPLAIVGAMAVAIVVSPLPSAPIALAAGALYGHLWGTVYIVTGAEIGALIAFTLARVLGYDTLHRWFGERVKLGVLGSQWGLAATIFVLRLIPFVSFDVVSYAAGLTPIAPWRFALATLAGVAPGSFVLAHFGGELTSANAQRALSAALVVGLVTLVPVGYHFLRRRRRHR